MWFGLPEHNTVCPRENGVVLLKPALLEPFLFAYPCEVVSTRAFYSSKLGSYIETRGPTGGPEVVETLYSI
jgi:hypothetical protein